jgi:hypothetical protein
MRALSVSIAARIAASKTRADDGAKRPAVAGDHDFVSSHAAAETAAQVFRNSSFACARALHPDAEVRPSVTQDHSMIGCAGNQQ